MDPAITTVGQASACGGLEPAPQFVPSFQPSRGHYLIYAFHPSPPTASVRRRRTVIRNLPPAWQFTARQGISGWAHGLGQSFRVHGQTAGWPNRRSDVSANAFYRSNRRRFDPEGSFPGLPAARLGGDAQPCPPADHTRSRPFHFATQIERGFGAGSQRSPCANRQAVLAGRELRPSGAQSRPVPADRTLYCSESSERWTRPSGARAAEEYPWSSAASGLKPAAG